MSIEKEELQHVLPGRKLKEGEKIFRSDAYSLQEIAEKLNISSETAQYHLRIHFKSVADKSKTCF
jgi:predicted transcriptional regulator